MVVQDGASSKTAARRNAWKVFRQLDTDKDRKLTVAEFLEGLEGLDPELKNEIFYAMDKDGDKLVTGKEFVNGFALWQNGVLRGEKNRRAAKENEEMLAQNFRIEKTISDTPAERVCLVTEKSTDMNYYARVIDTSHRREHQELQALRDELSAVKKLKHQYILDYKETYEDNDDVTVIMECCSGGSVLDCMAKTQYTEQQIARFMRMLLEAIEFCHTNGFAHRNITLDNMLLTAPALDKADLKVTGFSFVAPYRPGAKMRGVVGEVEYSAPETLQGSYDGAAADVWSCGVVLYILLCGELPFTNSTTVDYYHGILNEDPNFNMKVFDQPHMYDLTVLIKKMLSKDPSDRPSIQKILENDWIKVNGVAPQEPMDSEISQNIQKFAAKSLAKKHLYMLCADFMDMEDVIHLRELFQTLDKDESGRLTKDELQEVLEQLGTKNGRSIHSEVKKFFQAVDINQDSFIEWEELLSAAASANNVLARKNLYKAFRVVDQDGSGFITINELEAEFKNIEASQHIISGYDLAREYAQFDKTMDGKINFEEFMDYMTRNADETLAKFNKLGNFLASLTETQ